MQSFCPHCEKTTSVRDVRATLSYTIKGVDVVIETSLVKCDECTNEFENPELGHDVAGLALQAYREKTGLLSPNRIREFRKSLDLTQQELGKLLGWGGATLGRYENGSLQDEAHDRALRMIMEPDAMLGVLEHNPDILSSEKHQQLIERLQSSKNAEVAFLSLANLFWTDYDPDILSGYRRFSAPKFFAMILHFCRESGVPKTKLNKLLWYSDFLCFKRNSVSISGARYAHLPYGPVPDKYDFHLAFLTDVGKSLASHEAGNGLYTWETLVSNRPPDYSLFSNSELQIVTTIADYFGKATASKISDCSHDEKGYRETSDGELISYEFADDLMAFK